MALEQGGVAGIGFTLEWCGGLVCDLHSPEMGSLLDKPLSFHFNLYFPPARLCSIRIRFGCNCQLLEMCPS